MKKSKWSLIILFLSLTLVACSKDVIVHGSSDSDFIPDTTNQPSSIQDEFEENSNLKVVAAFNYDNDTYIVTENTGNKPILNFSVAYINFDANSFVTTTRSDGYVTGRDEAVNLMPGEKTISGWYSSSGDYAVAVVTSVDYADGSSWEAQNVKRWVKDVSSSFNVDTYKAEITALKELSNQAENNVYATITDYSLVHGNRFSSDLDLEFYIHNTSNQGIQSIGLFVLEFDSNGFPVSVSPYDMFCLNGHKTGGTVNLTAGQSDGFVDNLFIDGSTSQIKIVITDIVFQDGTTWKNPYIYEWIISNWNAY